MAIVRRLTTDEVAAESRRHPVTIRRALEGGRLHGTQSGRGGRWRVREDCLEAWLDGQPCEHQTSGARVVPLHARTA